MLKIGDWDITDAGLKLIYTANKWLSSEVCGEMHEKTTFTTNHNNILMQVISFYMQLLQREHIVDRQQHRSQRNLTFLPTYFYQKWLMFLQQEKSNVLARGTQCSTAGKRKRIINHPCNMIRVRAPVYM